MISKVQIANLKENIDKMSKSDEQFIMMIFRNPDGTNNITGYSYNMPLENIKYFFEKEILRGKIKTGEKE